MSNEGGDGMSSSRRMTWQPIKTAPKDGRRIIAATPSYTEPLILYWMELNGLAAWWDWDLDSYIDVTHWMPLPAAPEAT